MTQYDKRLADLDKQLEEIIKHPKNETVADYVKLASERSALLLKIEAERNLSSAGCVQKEKREALSRIKNIVMPTIR